MRGAVLVAGGGIDWARERHGVALRPSREECQALLTPGLWVPERGHSPTTDPINM
jgi:hypothetical protein